MEQIIFWGIILICLGMVIYCLIKEKKDGILNIFLRLSCGVAGIFCVNGILGLIGNTIIVGINGFSLSILAGLGAPGFVLLYVLSFLLVKP